MSKVVADEIQSSFLLRNLPISSAQEDQFTYKKEPYALLHIFKEVNYLLAFSTNVAIFTDHGNLLFTIQTTPLSHCTASIEC